MSEIGHLAKLWGDWGRPAAHFFIFTFVCLYISHQNLKTMVRLIMATYRKNPNPLKSTGSLPPVSPVEIDRVRRSVLDVVRKNIPKVRSVLNGDSNWSNQQVRLFSTMLNKVMPDLHHSFNQHSHEHKKVTELSIDELQQIASKADELDKDVVEVDVIEKENTDGKEESEGSVQRQVPKQAVSNS